MTTPIPTPPAVPLLGHATQLDRETPLLSFDLLADQYGEIYQLNLLGRNPIMINSAALMEEVSDDKRFYKTVTSGTFEVRSAVGDGLFTAQRDEPNWAIAHRLLMPAFGTAAIREMFDDMVDIASQLVLKWDRFGPRHRIDAVDDYTRLTFDTISLCAMSYRLNSYYRDKAHPFIEAMNDFLIESGKRANRPTILNNLMGSKYEEDIKTMAEVADELIRERKANRTAKKDLLDTDVVLKDPRRLLTFMIAEPRGSAQAHEEVDEVLGDQQIQVGDLSKLKYLAGKEFKPSGCWMRSLRSSLVSLATFGYGARACIGRPFAWQEALICLAMLLQKFDFALADPSYTLELKQTLTIKPKHFYIHAIPRHSTESRLYAHHLPHVCCKSWQGPGYCSSSDFRVCAASVCAVRLEHRHFRTVLSAYCGRRRKYGFRPTLGTLDSAAEHIPTDGL
ncbi:cytochrome P450 [Irpex lacteus]|nr:cytochrome P450 [Irpex lacteus]